MPKIRILPDRVPNQIAAGEVVERPAAVVKELVENALDAGATRIEVEFNHGGRAFMRVEDNGHGMGREDALLALERHATSKIAEAGDLDRLISFGFRGEALPSIASVSRFVLQTAEAEGAGTEILVNGGRLVHVRECGRPPGTRIEVAQLFNSVPARRKFLKTDATEAAHVVAAVRLHALAAPHCAFTLIEDGRVVFRSPTCGTLAERVGEIFGRQLAETLMPLDHSEGGLRLHGLIARPGATGQATRHATITFVNRRPVESRALTYGLIDAYEQSLPKGRYPAAFVFVELDPAAVDVNVHPAKREVRFREEAKVRGFVLRTVLGRLRDERPAGVLVTPITPAAEAAPLAQAPRITQGSGAPSWGAEPVRLPSPAGGGERAPAAVRPPEPRGMVPGVPARPASAGWRFIGLAHGTYALFETPSGLMLLDRKAAAERILFEELMERYQTGAALVQRLLMPSLIELDPVASALLRERLGFLAAHGFEVAEFGRDTYRLEAIPALLNPADGEACLRDLLDAFRDGMSPARDPAGARERIARLAANRATRLGGVPDGNDMRALIEKLFSCRAPHVSPTGRPTQVEFGLGELARRFGRS